MMWTRADWEDQNETHHVSHSYVAYKGKTNKQTHNSTPLSPPPKKKTNKKKNLGYLSFLCPLLFTKLNVLKNLFQSEPGKGKVFYSCPLEGEEKKKKE